jgi:hypothetical protein
MGGDVEAAEAALAGAVADCLTALDGSRMSDAIHCAKRVELAGGALFEALVDLAVMFGLGTPQ